jgi:pantoate--beta-alanine ligase
MLKVVKTEKQLRSMVRRWRLRGDTVGFVPTMGALHEGHMSLVSEAQRRCDRVVVSIYVNPTQFGPKEDFLRYPRPFLKDRDLCAQRKVDLIFAPQNLYSSHSSTWVNEEEYSQGRCGSFRPGHFRGVSTVVVKLLNLVQPDQLFLGWKDAQQVQVIQRVIADLNIPVKVVPVEILRDRDGLALSSRNIYLSSSDRQLALAIPLLLQLARFQKKRVPWLTRELSRIRGIRVDYVEEVEGRLCVAAWVGKTRLIDNIRALS